MKIIELLNKIANDEVEVCSTELSLKEATEKFYKISEALYKEANKKRKKEIEKLKWVDYNVEFTHKDLNKEFRNICNTIDKLIDKVDKLKGGNE